MDLREQKPMLMLMLILMEWFEVSEALLLAN
jgi:hypothetical protein